MSPHKKKDKKALKLAQQKAEEERLLQEENARIAEEEERKRIEEERRRKEEADRIRAEEAVIRQEQQSRLTVVLDEISALHNKKLVLEWYNERWHFYMHERDKIDALDLRVINTYLSHWNDDSNYEIQYVFDKCRESLQLLEEVRSAIMRCPDTDEKTVALWKEAVKNLNDMILKKLDLASFTILKNGRNYVNEDTQNVEFGVMSDETRPEVTLILFGNIYKKTRKRELEMFESGFNLPYEIANEDCVVRLMHTLFDPVTSESRRFELVPVGAPSPPDEESKIPELDVPAVSEEGSVTTVDTDIVDNALLTTQHSIRGSVGGRETQENELGIATNINTSDSEDMDAEEIRKTSTSLEVQGGGSSLEEKDSESSSSSEGGGDVEDWAAKYPLPKEVNLEVINMEEYILLGGVFHFGLFSVPNPTVSSGCWIFNYDEGNELQKMRYENMIVPPRAPTADMPPDDISGFLNYEKLRFQKELTNAICVEFKLPDSVLYLEDPIAVRYVPNKGFSSSEIFESKHFKETNRMHFKTYRFGVYGVLQKKYVNMPYQDWSLRCNTESSVTMTLNGSYVTVVIEISDRGCCLQQLKEETGGRSIADLPSEWMTPKQLVMLLRSFGINIVIEKGANEYIENYHLKDRNTEDWVYKCISLLCHVCNFFWVPLNAIARSDQLVLKYNLNIVNPEKSGTVLITPERSTTSFSQKGRSLSPEAVPEIPFCSDLYHLIICGLNEEQMLQVRAIDSSLSQNVQSLLFISRPFSCL